MPQSHSSMPYSHLSVLQDRLLDHLAADLLGRYYTPKPADHAIRHLFNGAAPEGWQVGMLNTPLNLNSEVAMAFSSWVGEDEEDCL
jgi:hypothetical protein